MMRYKEQFGDSARTMYQAGMSTREIARQLGCGVGTAHRLLIEMGLTFRPVGGRRHGYTGTRVHAIWKGMLGRCLTPTHTAYVNYGAKGIKVCERWLTFESFLADMGEPPIGMSIERKNNNGNYEPDNCKWASRKEQQSNTTRNRYLTFNDKTLTVTQWSDELQINDRTLIWRLDNGWSIEDALTAHSKQQRRQQK